MDLRKRSKSKREQFPEKVKIARFPEDVWRSSTSIVSSMTSSLDGISFVTITPDEKTEYTVCGTEGFYIFCIIKSPLPIQLLQTQVWTNVIHENNQEGKWHSIDMILDEMDDFHRAADNYRFQAYIVPDTYGTFQYTVRVGLKDDQSPNKHWNWADKEGSIDYRTLKIIPLPVWVDFEYTPGTSDFDVEYNKMSWVKRWVNMDNTFRIISDPTKEEKWCKPIKNFKKVNSIYRISDDYEATFGDGGQADMIFPIWKCDCLPVSKETKRKLTEELHKLSLLRKDYQKLSPVEDIIDPDFAPYVKPQHEIDLELRSLAMKVVGSDDDEFEDEEQEDRMTKDEMIENSLERFSENVKIRSSYQWVPSEFSVDSQGNVSINSPIHNLPLEPQNQTLYSCITQVFQAMVPMFAHLNLIKEGKTNLQVIVKAQSYYLQPGMSYAGRWHMEGQTENIVAAGVYYCHVGSGLQGGNLKFRPAKAPQPIYDIPTDTEATTEEGTAVVFANTLPHRFRKIINRSPKPQRRTFLNFFIVDPSKPIVSTKTIGGLDAEFLRKVLKHYVKNDLKRTLPTEIASYIVSFLPGVWESTSAAKKFRQKARQAMVDDKSGWGWIHWGNCGEVIFESSITTKGQDKDYEQLRHTDSDTAEKK